MTLRCTKPPFDRRWRYENLLPYAGSNEPTAEMILRARYECRSAMNQAIAEQFIKLQAVNNPNGIKVSLNVVVVTPEEYMSAIYDAYTDGVRTGAEQALQTMSTKTTSPSVSVQVKP